MSIVVAIIVLGVIIFIHELGHFILAKLNGVYVEKFSLGFGPRICGFKYGETEYCISAFPLGGFVKMYGEVPEDDDENDNEDDNKNENNENAIVAKKETPPDKIGRAYTDKTSLQKALILLAGPCFNILTAIIIFCIIFASGTPDYSAIIGTVENNSPAAKAGLVLGDKIVAVNNKEVKSWSNFDNIIATSPNKKLILTLEDERTVEITPIAKEGRNLFNEVETIGYIGVALYLPPTIGTIQPDSVADNAGIEQNDKIISINNDKITTWQELAAYIRERPNEELALQIEREGQILSINATPKLSKIQDDTGHNIEVGLLGISPIAGDTIIKYNIFQSVIKGFQKSYEFTILVFKGLFKLIAGKVPADSLGGPILIVQMAASSAQSGFMDLLAFIAVISLNLAIFNLLPIPVLDGGNLLVVVIEGIIRREISDKLKYRFQLVGFSLLICLTIFVFYNDIARLIL